MKTKLLFLFTFVIGLSATIAQSFSNVTTVSSIPTNTTEFTVTFEFKGISVGGTMEWQVKHLMGLTVSFGSPTVCMEQL
ncbi:hypothetical protein [Aquimarina algiphila]|uniref:hypothetical protein n=1 Tax=Aquimarina algiphila TaxID=2047982 RepID=UPI002493B78D|nr:hypothetical protein [Aquimarina algiphila]